MANEDNKILSAINDLKARGYTPEDIQKAASNITRGDMTLNPNADLMARVARGMEDTEYTPPATELIQDQPGYDPETNTIKPVTELKGLAQMVQRNKEAIAPKQETSPQITGDDLVGEGRVVYEQPGPEYNGFDLSSVDGSRIRKLEEAAIRNRKAVAKGKELLVDRTLAEHAQDIGVAIGPKLAAFAAQTLYGAAELNSQTSPTALVTKGIDSVLGTDLHTGLDEATAELSTTGEAFSQKLQKVSESVNELKSDKLLNQEKEVNAAVAARQNNKAKRIADLEKRGVNTGIAHAIDLYDDVKFAGSEYLGRPTVVASAIAEAVPQMLIGGVVGKVATRVALSKVTPETAARFLRTDAGKKAMQKVATRANIGYVAATEGFTNAVDAKATVLNSTADDLRMSNPDYVDMVDNQDMTHEKAKFAVSENVFENVLYQTGIAAGLISKGSGAAHFQGNLFTPGTKLAKALPTGLSKGALAGGSEAVEEAAQSGAGQLIQNVELKDAAIAGQDVTEGVGNAVAIGGLAGFGSGALTTGTVGAITDILDAAGLAKDAGKVVVKSAAKKIAESKAGVAFKNKKMVDNAIKGGVEAEAKIYDTTDENYDAETAVNLALDKRKVGSTAEELRKTVDIANEHVGNLLAEAQELTAREDTTVEEEEESARKTAAVMVFIKKIAAIEKLGELPQEEMAAKIQKIALDSSEDAAKEVPQVLASSPTVQEARKLLENKNLDADTKSRVTNYVNTRERIEAVTANDVTNAIIHGDEKNLGIDDHMLMVRTSTDAGNKKSAIRSLKNLAVFRARHAKKLAGLEKAWKEYRTNPSPELIAQVKKEFDFDLQSGSGRLIEDRIKPEVAALDAAYLEAKNYVLTGDLGKSTTKEVKAVPTEVAQEEAPVVDTTPTVKGAPTLDTSPVVSTAKELDPVFQDTDFSKYPKFMETAARNAETKEAAAEIATIMNMGMSVEGILSANGVVNKSPKTAKVSGMASYTNGQLTAALKSAKLPDTPENRNLTYKVENGIKLSPNQLIRMRKIVNKYEQTLKTKATDKVRQAVSNVVGNLVNEGTVLAAYKKKAEEISNKVKQHFTNIVEKLPESERASTLKNMKAGIIAYNEGIPLSRLKTKAHRAGYVTAKRFLEKPAYGIKQALAKGGNLADKFKTTVSSKNILHTNKNAISNFDRESAAYTALDDKQTEKLENILHYVKEFQSTFVKVYAARVKDTLDNTPLKEFFDVPEGFKVDSNIPAAMALQAYSFLADQTEKGIIATPEAVANLFPNRQGRDEATDREMRMFGDVGVNRKQLAQLLGRGSLKTMGIKPNPETAPQQTVDKLELNIGLQIIEVMEEQGLIETTTISNKDIAKVIGDTNYAGGKESTLFVNVKRDPSDLNKTAPELSRFVEEIGSARIVMQEFFDIEPKVTAPSTKPPKFTQKFLKGTTQYVPKRIAKIIQKHMERPHVLKEKLVGVFMDLTEESQQIIGGLNMDTSLLHAEERDSAEAKNKALDTELEHLRNFYSGMEDKSTPFYFTHVIWKNFRMGIASNTINPQTSKIHRHALGAKNFIVDIIFSDRKMVDNFTIAVGEALGTGPDKTSKNTSIKQALETINKPVIQAAIDAYIQIQNDNHSAEAEAALVAGVKAGGNAMYSLDGIAALAAQKLALDAGADSFTTDLGREVDGVTNGVAIGITQLISSDSWPRLQKMLARVGLFTDRDEEYGHWANGIGNYDSYEDISLKWMEVLKQVHSNIFDKNIEDNKQRPSYIGRMRKLGVTPRRLNALRSLVGTFREDELDSAGNILISKIGRALAKNPLMITNYGAAITKVVEEFVSEIVSKIHSDAAKAVNAMNQANLDGDAAAWQAARDDLARMGTALSEVVGNTVVLDKENGLTSEKDLTVFSELISNYYGEALNQAITSKFSMFINARSTLNTALDYTTTMFNTIYEGKVDERRQAWIKANPGKPFVDLTIDEYKAIEEEIIELAPIAKNFLSDSADDSAMLSDKEDRTDDRDKARVVVRRKEARTLRTKTVGLRGIQEETTTGVKDINSRAPKKRFASPGVGGVISLIHGIDASTMYGLIDKFSGLNVHDAILFSLLDIEEGTSALNDSFAQVTLGNYSIVEEVMSSLHNTYEAYVGTEAHRETKGKLGEFNTGLSDFLESTISFTKNTRLYREQIKENVKAVQQYNKGTGGKAFTDYSSTELAEVRSEKANKAERLSVIENDVPVYKTQYDKKTRFSQVKVRELLKAIGKVVELAKNNLPVYSMDTGNLTDDLKTLIALGNKKLKAKPSAATKKLLNKLKDKKQVLADMDTLKEIPEPYRGLLPEEYKPTPQEKEVAFENDVVEKQKLLSESGIYLTNEIKAVYDSFVGAPMAIYKTKLDQLAKAAKSTSFTAEYRSPINENTELTGALMDEAFEAAETALTAKEEGQLVNETEVAHLANSLYFIRKGMSRSQDNSAVRREKLRSALKAVYSLLGKRTDSAPRIVAMPSDISTAPAIRNAGLKNTLAYDSNVNTNVQLEQLYKAYPLELRGLVNTALRSLGVGDQQFGSSADTLDVNNFNADHEMEVNALTSEGVFQLLGKLGAKQDDAAHTAHLNKLLTQTVNKVVEPFKFELRQRADQTVGAQVGNRVLLDAGTGSLLTSLGLSAQEVYVHELVHYISKHAINSSTLAARKVEKLWELARKTMTAESFLSKDDAGNVVDKDGNVISPSDAAYAAELDEATKRYDYIFNNTSSDSQGRNAYLHEFLTFGVTNKAFMQSLNAIAAKDVSKLRAPGETLPAKLWNIFADFMDMITNKVTSIHKLQADTALMALLENLAAVEDRNKSVIAKAYDAYNMGLDFAVRKLADFVLAPLTKAFTSDLARKTRVTNGIASFVDAGKKLKEAGIARYPVYRTAIKEVVKRLGFSEKSLLIAMAHEINGTNGLSGKWEELNRKANKMIDQLRIDTMKKVAGHLNDTFVEDSLTPERRKAITLGLMKTDVSALLDDDAYSMATIRKLFKSPVLLREEIAKLEAKMEAYGDNKNYYRKMAESLGNMMVTGKATEYETKLNSYVIANLYETDLQPVGDLDLANQEIDILATLYAMNKLDAETRLEVNNTFDTEFDADEKHNGITFLLQVHQDHKQRALDGLFDGDPTQFRKGYTKEIYDPNISVEYGSVADEEIYAKSHFTRVGNNALKADLFDPNQNPVALYVNPNGGNATWQQGATSLTSRRAAGTSLLSKRIREANEITRGLELGDADNEAYYNGKAARLAAINSDSDSRIRPEDSALVPIINQKGGTAGYRYMMSESTKNSVLNKNNDFAEILGGMEASIKDKQNTLDINSEVVNTAFEQYKNEYSKNPENFVYVGAESQDAEYREIYQMLPAEMRSEIRKVWRKDGMFVPDTLVPLIFGQRKWVASSLGSEEHIDSLESENMKKFFTQVGKFTNNKRVIQAGGIWKEIIKGVKDIIVIRSGTVLVGNIISNVMLLSAKGVSPTALFKNHVVAIEAATSYQKDTKELDRLERLERTGNGTKENTLKMARLRNSIANNKVKDLIDEGIYQSIVEDISTVDDTFTYKNRLENWVAPVTDKVPEPIKTGLRYATFAQDTAVYKFLRDTTQLSDFVARYTLHEANLANNMSKEDSLTDIVRTFIDYDLPTHKALQYANDMGVVMFTKFFLRVQRVLADLIINHPGKVLSIALLQNAIGPVSDVMDSNPITSDILGKINTSPWEAADGVTALPLVQLLD